MENYCSRNLENDTGTDYEDWAQELIKGGTEPTSTDTVTITSEDFQNNMKANGIELVHMDLDAIWLAYIEALHKPEGAQG